MNEPWRLKGDFVLSCSCTVFCPCVISLGQHAPTEGYCQTWAAVRIDQGHFGEVDLTGITPLTKIDKKLKKTAAVKRGKK